MFDMGNWLWVGDLLEEVVCYFVLVVSYIYVKVVEFYYEKFCVVLLDQVVECWLVLFDNFFVDVLCGIEFLLIGYDLMVVICCYVNLLCED